MNGTARLCVAAAVIACGLGGAAGAVTITNGGFETSDLTGWNELEFPYVWSDATVQTCAGLTVGCSPGGGQWVATLSDSYLPENDNSGLLQVISLDPGNYTFGAQFAFGVPTNYFFQLDNFWVVMSVASESSPTSKTVHYSLNAQSELFQSVPDDAGYRWTDWLELTGSLTHAGNGSSSFEFIFQLYYELFDDPYWDPLTVHIDNLYLSPVGDSGVASVPVPAGLVLMATALACLGALRRRAKAA